MDGQSLSKMSNDELVDAWKSLVERNKQIGYEMRDLQREKAQIESYMHDIIFITNRRQDQRDDETSAPVGSA